jgi:hypothetical protein
VAELLLYAYVTAVGFVAAGLCTSLARLVTGRPLAFAVDPGAGLLVPAAVVARVIAGPAILMRGAIARANEADATPAPLALATFAAALWSFLSGVVILDVTLRLVG